MRLIFIKTVERRNGSRESWTVTPGTWDGTGDLAVCAIFPFVIFIQIGGQNDNGRCGGKSCEHFNEVNVRNLRKFQ